MHIPVQDGNSHFERNSSPCWSVCSCPIRPRNTGVQSRYHTGPGTQTRSYTRWPRPISQCSHRNHPDNYIYTTDIVTIIQWGNATYLSNGIMPQESYPQLLAWQHLRFNSLFLSFAASTRNATLSLMHYTKKYSYYSQSVTWSIHSIDIWMELLMYTITMNGIYDV